METVLFEADVSTLCLVTCCVLYWLAEISGPSWNIPLKPNELADILGMLSQLRIMVANLSANGQWLGGNGDRPQSRVKVGGGGGHGDNIPGFTHTGAAIVLVCLE